PDVLADELSDCCGNGAEGQEYSTEPQHEKNRVQHDRSREPAIALLQLLDARARDQRDVSRYERQYARRQERDQSGYKCGNGQRMHPNSATYGRLPSESVTG